MKSYFSIIENKFVILSPSKIRDPLKSNQGPSTQVKNGCFRINYDESLNNIDHLVFLMENHCIFCEAEIQV